MEHTTLSHTDISFQDEYIIKAYDIDMHKNASPLALLKLMHETAMQNVMKLNISVWDLEPLHLSWVLMRQYVHFDRLPKLGKKIQILTYPAGFQKVMTYRDYKVVDEQGALIIHSSSTWLLMDTQKRTLTNIPPAILALKKDIPPSETCLPRANFKLAQVKTPTMSKHYEVGWFDLDFNGHANNIPYLRWMLEPLESHLKKWQLSHLEIQYKAECHWKDRVVAQVQPLENNSFLHRLINENDGKVLAQARTSWRLK